MLWNENKPWALLGLVSVSLRAPRGCVHRMRAEKGSSERFLKQWQCRVKNIKEPEMPEGDDPASLQDSKQLARWLWVSFCSCNLVLIRCNSESQQWTWQQWQRREGGCQGFLRMHEKKAFESLGPMGSAVRDLSGCLKPTQVNITKGELPMLTSQWKLCLPTLLGPVRAWGRRAVQPFCLLQKLTGFSLPQLEHCATLVVQWGGASPTS